MLPNWLYYLLLSYDILARWTFIVALVLDPSKYWLLSQPLLFSSLLLGIDMIRRFCWLIIRIENENVNNYELFRAVKEIPELKLEEDKDNVEDIKYHNMVINIFTNFEQKRKSFVGPLVMDKAVEMTPL